MKTDNQLLEGYARHGSERDFRELVERRISLVHSAALRESKGDASHAEDVTQAVFTELARRAASLVRHPALAGWLYTCVRRMAANVRRAEDRRQRREQEAFTMNELLSPDPADKLWQQLRPVLDDIMHELNEEDRTAVVLRFFEGRSLKDVGLALGLSENAARMRVERSLEKLRHFLSQRGVKSAAASLSAVLAFGAVSSTSAALSGTVATGALASAALSGSSAFTVANLVRMTKVKLAAAGAAIVLASAFVVWHQGRTNRPDASASAPTQTFGAAQEASAANSGAQVNATLPTSASTNSIASPQMMLRVVDAENGAPLSGAKIHLAYFRDDYSAKVVKEVTDTNGTLGVDMPQPPFNSVNLFAAADAHAPKTVSWHYGHTLPDDFTLKLPPGTMIAGVINDEAGKPVAGAKIEFDTPGGSDVSQQENVEFGPDTATRTDANGRWFCNMIPKDLDKVHLLITHTNHAETEAVIRPDASDAKNSVVTMASGFTIAGAVADANGLAIRGAKVRQVRMNSEREASETTDAFGNFVFKNMKAGQLILSVQAEGFAPAVQMLQVTGMVAALKFQLGAGYLLRGHVVDEAGNPIPHARAKTESDGAAIRKFEWSAQMGTAGRFEWDSAPEEPLRYSFSADGFAPIFDLALPADGTDHEIKLALAQPGKHIIQITGTAVDADAGQPLDAFTVQLRRIEPDWVVPFEFATFGEHGKFTLLARNGSLHTNYQLQLEKDGYLPALSTILLAKDGNQTLAFKLQKGSGPSGVVLLPDGEPAANATVYLCTSQMGVDIDGPCHVQKGLNTTKYIAHTDDGGKFSLPAADSPEGVIVMHDQGFAQLSMAALAASSNITLQAWGRIEGSLVLDSQPVANDRVYARHQILHFDKQGRHFGFMTYEAETTTDSEGKFSFDKVPPGPYAVFRYDGDHGTQIVINPGTVTQVALGGAGRPVIGNAVLPNATGEIDWTAASVKLTLKSDNEPGPRPKLDNFSSAADFIQATQNWRSAIDAQHRFSVCCNATGSFRLQDIPPGAYELEIALLDPTPHVGVARELAAVRREITVPETPSGHSDEPLDLGTLELVRSQNTASAR